MSSPSRDGTPKSGASAASVSESGGDGDDAVPDAAIMFTDVKKAQVEAMADLLFILSQDEDDEEAVATENAGE